jgi:hypothetical protein
MLTVITTRSAKPGASATKHLADLAHRVLKGHQGREVLKVLRDPLALRDLLDQRVTQDPTERMDLIALVASRVKLVLPENEVNQDDEVTGVRQVDQDQQGHRVILVHQERWVITEGMANQAAMANQEETANQVFQVQGVQRDRRDPQDLRAHQESAQGSKALQDLRETLDLRAHLAAMVPMLEQVVVETPVRKEIEEKMDPRDQPALVVRKAQVAITRPE